VNHGITRITITDSLTGVGAWRFRKAAAKQSAANVLYRTIFNRLGMPLLPGDKSLCTTLAEFESGYDRYLGIDVIFTFSSGQEATLQEKFLSWHESTVTVEFMQDPKTGEQGDWFKLKADYYFVGYDRLEANNFQEWMLLNWPLVRQMTNQGLIPWQVQQNKRDGARANFKFVHFDQVPSRCIVHGQWNKQEHIESSTFALDMLRQEYRQQRSLGEGR